MAPRPSNARHHGINHTTHMLTHSRDTNSISPRSNTAPLLIRLKGFIFSVIRLSLISIAVASLACHSQSKPGELTMMIEKRITTFDPRASSDSANERMRQLIFNGLTRKNDKFEPVPD